MISPVTSTAAHETIERELNRNLPLTRLLPPWELAPEGAAETRGRNPASSAGAGVWLGAPCRSYLWIWPQANRRGAAPGPNPPNANVANSCAGADNTTPEGWHPPPGNVPIGPR